MAKLGNIDRSLMVAVIIMTAIGAAMVYSASAYYSLRETEGASQFSFFFKQLGFILVGIAAMFAMSRIDYKILNNRWIVALLCVVTVALLTAVLFSGSINGAQRWIRFGGLSLQPSEGAKLTLAIFLAYWLHKKGEAVDNITGTILPCLAALAVFAGLIMAGRDLGTTMIVCSIFATICFAAGVRKMHLASIVGIMGVIGLAAILTSPFRMQRILAFGNPEDFSQSSGYQVIQSLQAIGSGGIYGEGFGSGHIKLTYLPFPYSDFIFSVVGEEFGVIGTLVIVGAYLFIMWRGARIALHAPDRFGLLLGIGIITSIIVQALFNISVVTSLLPAKGIPLPFISFGGTSMVVTLIGIGILLSISRQAVPAKTATDRKRPVRRKGR